MVMSKASQVGIVYDHFLAQNNPGGDRALFGREAPDPSQRWTGPDFVTPAPTKPRF